MTAGLSAILEETRQVVEQLRTRRSILERAAREAPAPVPWLSAFAGEEVAVIAEVKRRSPSQGVIAETLDPRQQATAYAAGGARAISVLTERHHFGGSVQDIIAVRAGASLPVLRKDFILDPVQIVEARAVGASAILLIVRALTESRLGELVGVARELGLGQLIEVHDERELRIALSLEPQTVGINSRDLASLVVHPVTHHRLLPQVPADIVAVAESGLAGRADVERVAGWGADAVLIGTVLSRAPHPERAVRLLSGVPRHGRSRRNVSA